MRLFGLYTYNTSKIKRQRFIECLLHSFDWVRDQRLTSVYPTNMKTSNRKITIVFPYSSLQQSARWM